MNRRKFIKTMLIGAGACAVPGVAISKIKTNASLTKLRISKKEWNDDIKETLEMLEFPPINPDDYETYQDYYNALRSEFVRREMARESLKQLEDKIEMYRSIGYYPGPPTYQNFC